jgi:uncharacterized protein
MLVVISPAKILNFKPQERITDFTIPDFLERSDLLIQKLRTLSPKGLAGLFKVSNSIAELNFQRFMAWNMPFTINNAKQAVLAFNGEVYNGLKANTLSAEGISYAQNHLRILSGLYGILRPLDLIQPYRLEMSIKLTTSKAKDLYQFWGNTITQKLIEAMQSSYSEVLVNLASKEYFKSINTKILPFPVFHIEFRENKNGQYLPIVIYTKKARGLMTRFIMQNKLTDPEDLKAFDDDGYIFNSRLSKDNHLVFTRR